ncbi:hypothetical protein BpHYR1_029164, partial [Brachionus plicatilis]
YVCAINTLEIIQPRATKFDLLKVKELITLVIVFDRRNDRESAELANRVTVILYHRNRKKYSEDVIDNSFPNTILNSTEHKEKDLAAKPSDGINWPYLNFFHSPI